MPEGPLGFDRLTNIGPFSRQKASEMKRQWEPCEENARDQTDIIICREVKRSAVEILLSQDILPLAEDLEEINEGLCGVVSSNVLDAVDNDQVKAVNSGGMNWLHCWIEYNGRHFDAEAPTGVDDPTQLPMLKRLNVEKLDETHIHEGFP